MPQISDYIGNQIRMYRKNKHLTLEQFSTLLHKSKSTISKYENGEIAIDIETLYDISRALHIDVRQLLAGVEQTKTDPVSVPSGFFSRVSRYYVYYYLNKSNDTILLVQSILDVFHDQAEPSSIMYVNLNDFNTPNRCRLLYYGDIHYSDSFANLVLQNQDNDSERIFFYILNTFGQETITTGMLSGISSKYMVPIAIKAIVSQIPLALNNPILNELKISKQDFASIRKTCCFSIERNSIEI